MERLPFYTSEMDRADIHPTAETIDLLLDVLNDPRLTDQILAGNVTLAMIRPNVGPEANLMGLPDIEGAKKIEEMISELGVLAKFSIQFTPAIVEEFYAGGPKASMLKQIPKSPDIYPNQWPEFIDTMSTGPITVLLLHSPNGDAIDKWRSHLGHWNIDAFRDPETIRGKLGVDKFNNLVHGSDSPESVLRELGIITHCLKENRESLGQ